MRWLGKARFLNVTVAAVAVLAWFAGTNHCLLGLIKQPQNPVVSTADCPDHAKKSGGADNGPSGMLACCQGLQSPNFEVGKTNVAFRPVLLATQLFTICHLVLPQAAKSILPKTEYDTGPPAVSSFVGTVLRRSLRENAPPLLS
jgi:hypothetical protein